MTLRAVSLGLALVLVPASRWAASAQPDALGDHLVCRRVNGASAKRRVMLDTAGGRFLALKTTLRLVCDPARVTCCDPATTSGCVERPCPGAAADAAPLPGLECYAVTAKACADAVCVRTVARSGEAHGAGGVAAPQMLCVPTSSAVAPTTSTTTAVPTTATTTTTTSATCPTITCPGPTTTTLPCGPPDAAGLCGGPCPAGQQCVATSDTTCACVLPSGGCSYTAPLQCGGPCPYVGDSCGYVSPYLGCQCIRTCGGIDGDVYRCDVGKQCPPGRTCTADLGGCLCH